MEKHKRDSLDEFIVVFVERVCLRPENGHLYGPARYEKSNLKTRVRDEEFYEWVFAKVNLKEEFREKNE